MSVSLIQSPESRSAAVTHDLKTQPEPFEAVWVGLKNFELRNNDRNFALGDVLLLREYDCNSNEYTGRAVEKTITYIIQGGEWELPSHLCILGWEI